MAHGAVAETETAKLAISCFLFSCSLERPSSVLSYRDRRISAIDDVDDAAGQIGVPMGRPVNRPLAG